MRVLFIGNSHTYFNDMPHTFAVMCRALTGEEPEVTMLAFSGKSLAWHMEDPLSLRFALRFGRYDYCVVQQQAHPFPGEETTAENAEKIFSLCRAAGTVPVVYMTWAERDRPENAAVMSRVYRKLARESDALLAPVGELFETLRREHPEIGLYAEDGGHASPAGDYLIAAAFAFLLTGARDLSPLSDRCADFHLSPADAPRDADGMNMTLDADTARILRKTAERVRA